MKVMPENKIMVFEPELGAKQKENFIYILGDAASLNHFSTIN